MHMIFMYGPWILFVLFLSLSYALHVLILTQLISFLLVVCGTKLCIINLHYPPPGVFLAVMHFQSIFPHCIRIHSISHDAPLSIFPPNNIPDHILRHPHRSLFLLHYDPLRSNRSKDKAALDVEGHC